MSRMAGRWTVVAATLLATACSGDDRGTPAVDDAEAPRATAQPIQTVETVETVAPLDEGALRPILTGIGLGIDRAVELPGSDEVAFVVVTDGSGAIDTWTRLHDAVPETGRYPVIVGGPRDYGGGVTSEFALTQDLWQFAEPGYTTTSELAAAAEVDVSSWLEGRIDALGILDEELAIDGRLPRYDWPKDTYLSTSDVLTDDPYEWIEIALLPTSAGWEAPVHLMWGGWNDVPVPRELAAVFHHWTTTYDARPVAMTGAVVEFAVGAPPSDDDAAIELAREQFLVAPDLVWQGAGDLAVLAAAVQDAPVWYFWWD